MKNIEFNTQICTTIEQSKRLLELGLDNDTADMFHPAQHIGKDIVRYSDSPMRVQEEHFEIFVDDLPAWSLHRLIAMLPDRKMTWLAVYCDSKDCSKIYGEVISLIEWMIENEYFNKEYLKEE